MLRRLGIESLMRWGSWQLSRPKIALQVVVKIQILASGRVFVPFNNGLKGGLHTVKTYQSADFAGKMLATKQIGPREIRHYSTFSGKRKKSVQEDFAATFLKKWQCPWDLWIVGFGVWLSILCDSILLNISMSIANFSAGITEFVRLLDLIGCCVSASGKTALLLYLFRRHKIAPKQFISYGPLKKFDLLIILGVTAFFVPMLISFAIMTKSVAVADPRVACGLSLVQVNVSAVIEEVIYRGILLASLTSHVSVPYAVLFSATVFSVVHFEDFLQHFLFAGCVYCVTRNLWVSVALHVGHNSLVLITHRVLYILG